MILAVMPPEEVLTSSSQSSESMQPPPLPIKRTSAAEPGKAGNKAGKGDKEKSGRQSFSCAECRRLKLKCSREWPCTSCEKRGCAQICPNGEMRTGKGKRLILADTAELHQRISLLEVALSQSHAKNSSTPHPLLESPYLFSPREPRSCRNNSKSFAGFGNGPEAEDELLQGAFGTLTIGHEGQAKFVGSFAGSEYLREGEGSGDELTGSETDPGVLGEENACGQNATEQRRQALATPPATAEGRWSRNEEYNSLPSLGLHSFLLAGEEVKHDLDKLRDELPDYDREGRALVRSYWENVNWQYQPVPRAMFENDHILNAYDTESPPNAHKLACVFLVMALGSMFDLNRPPFHPRGEQLFMLGRACISVVGIEQASPATVQAMHLMGTYILNDKRGNGGEVFWPILGTAVKIAQSLGLHRDGEHYGLSQYEVEERRQVWWEIVSYDRLQALCFGRPCSTSYRWSDTKIPEVPELIGDETGFHRAKYGLMHLMERVIDVQTQVVPVSLTVVSQLDSDLREYKKNLPELLMPNVAINDLPLDPNVHPHLVIHRFGIRLQIAQMRLLLNRPLFARALKDSPGDPSHSKFGSSFVVLFENAQEIVHLVKALVIYHPSLVARWWFFWFHAFSSAVCLAAIAIRAPQCAFASPSFHAMSIVCDISAAAREGCRAKKGLPILIRLRKRAHGALVAASRTKNKVVGDGSGEEDDLSHLVGSAKLRRVQAPLRGPSASSSNGTGAAVGIGMAGGVDGTPSPNSGGSIATASTLVDNGLYDAGVPAFAGDQATPLVASSYPAGSYPLMTSSSWGSEDPLNGYIPNYLISCSGAGPRAGTNRNTWPNISNSSPSTNVPVSPGYDGQVGVDMDMSMALGINMSMGMGGGLGMPGQHSQGDEGGGQTRYQDGMAGRNAEMGGQDGDMFGFNFEVFVNQMGGAA
ncbi:hypothetical protein AYX15_03919 [Cryptococcus neoformans]|nr:hypothetical protein AYX15_03919 [Cryptococcus neoformans var. grubii]